MFVTKYSSSGARQWFKHFGGNKDDYCSGIAVNTIDKPIIAGSFENRFNVPYSPAFTVFPSNVSYMGSTGFGFCSYANFHGWVSQQTKGQKDIFVASPVDMGQAPLDYFVNTTGICALDFVTPCISCIPNISISPIPVQSNLASIT